MRKRDSVHYYNDGVLSGFVEEHLACRISALGTRKKRVPWIPSAVFPGKYTARISSRDATYENYLSARLFRASRESRKVRRPGVFIFSTALQIRAASLLSEFIIKRAAPNVYYWCPPVKREPVRAYVADKETIFVHATGNYPFLQDGALPWRNLLFSFCGERIPKNKFQEAREDFHAWKRRVIKGLIRSIRHSWRWINFARIISRWIKSQRRSNLPLYFEKSFTDIFASSLLSKCIEDYVSIDESYLHCIDSRGISLSLPPLLHSPHPRGGRRERGVPLNSHARRDVFLRRGGQGGEDGGKESRDAASKQNGETAWKTGCRFSLYVVVVSGDPAVALLAKNCENGRHEDTRKKEERKREGERRKK